MTAMPDIPARLRDEMARIDAADWHDLPRGHYAIPVLDDELVDDDLPILGYWLYQRMSSRLTKTGRRIGRDGLRRGFQWSLDVPADRREAKDYLVRDEDVQINVAAILNDPSWFAAEFGRFTSKCGWCGRRLTDAASKMRGIGPECTKGLS